MKKLLSMAILAVALMLTVSGCKNGTLQSGGSYSPTNSVGQAISAPDLAFYQVDAAFDLAYSTIDAAYKFEQDNRVLLWDISPNIKQTLDAIRPDSVKAVQAYGLARSAYLASPTPAGLSTLQTWLAKAQQLATSAQAVIASLPKGN